MGDITKNLSRSEFACPKSGIDTVDYELALVLQDCVDYFQQKNPDKEISIHINSGNRSPEYNATIAGASKTSKHTEYRAADFFLYNKKTGIFSTAIHINESDVADYLEHKYSEKFGIGRYVGRNHLDTRSDPARWDKR